MLDALMQVWAGVASAIAPVKLLLLAAFLAACAVALCLVGWCCCAVGVAFKRDKP
jgi:hypothetical protein